MTAFGFSDRFAALIPEHALTMALQILMEDSKQLLPHSDISGLSCMVVDEVKNEKSN